MKISLCFLFLFILIETYAQKKMAIEIEIVAETSIDTLFLVKGKHPYKNENVVDSFVVRNNKAKIHFPVQEFDIYLLRSSLSKGVNLLSLIVSPGGKAKVKWIIHGPQRATAIFAKSSANERYQKEVIIPGDYAIKKMNSYIIDSIYKNPNNPDSLKKVYYRSLNNFWADSLKSIYTNHIVKFPKEYSSLYFLHAYYRDFNDTFVKDFIKQLPKKLKQHTLTKELAFYKFTVEKIKNFSEFPLKDSTGKVFKYTEFSNSVVLVDFWASWCKPCLENIPKIDSLQLKFQNQQFKILGVSIDEKKDAWVRALRREKMPWVNLHEEMSMKGMTVKFFRILAIPRYVLLGKDGIILNKDLKLEDAENAIKEALK